MNCNFRKDSNKIFFLQKKETKIAEWLRVEKMARERRETRDERRETRDGSLGNLGNLGKPLTTSNSPNTL